jgi:hypothetical protein
MNSDENSSEIREMTPATLRRFLRLNAHIAPAASSSTSSRPRSVNSSRGDRSLSGSSNSSGGASTGAVVDSSGNEQKEARKAMRAAKREAQRRLVLC